MIIPIQLLHDDVETPKYETAGSSGFDLAIYNFKTLYVSMDYRSTDIEQHPVEVEPGTKSMYLTPHSRVLVGCGFKIAIPEGYELQIRPRSGLALKKGLTCANAVGTVDSDYRGEVGVILLNTSNHSIFLSKGDRVAQGIITVSLHAGFHKVEALPETTRGEGGFGSTGYNSWVNSQPIIIPDPPHIISKGLEREEEVIRIPQSWLKPFSEVEKENLEKRVEALKAKAKFNKKLYGDEDFPVNK